ncbi:MAG: hypothetical protein ABJB86_15925 [Bacteroidota bacterium]
MRLVILFLLILPAVHAQNDAAIAIQKICTAYNHGETISFSGSLSMYAKSNPDKIIEKMQSSYIIRGSNFSCSIGPVQMLLNDEYYVSVDKTIKLIMIGNKKDLSGTEQMPVLNISQFKKWIEEKEIKATIIRRGNNSVLTLTDVQGITGYNIYNITYDNATGYMKKVLLELSDANDPEHKTIVLEINYSKPVLAGRTKDAFSEKQFFTITQNKIQVASDYKNYQVINQL